MKATIDRVKCVKFQANLVFHRYKICGLYAALKEDGSRAACRSHWDEIRCIGQHTPKPRDSGRRSYIEEAELGQRIGANEE